MSTTMTTTKSNETKRKNSSLPQSENGHGEQNFQAVYSPRFDIWEGDDEYVLYGDLPGVSSDDLEIQFENRQLTLLGRVSRNCDNANRIFTEYGIGNFQRVFTLGEAINSEGITAELHDGVLTLHLPKSDEAKPRRIEVKAN